MFFPKDFFSTLVFLDVAMYSSNLVSYLSVRQYSKPIDFLRDLLYAVKFQGYTWGTVDESSLLELFQVRK